MELPTYKIPSPRVVLHRAYDRGRAFVTRAGTLIFATAIVVWFAGYFPGDHRELNGVLAQIQVQQEERPPTILRRRPSSRSSSNAKTSSAAG